MPSLASGCRVKQTMLAAASLARGRRATAVSIAATTAFYMALVPTVFVTDFMLEEPLEHQKTLVLVVEDNQVVQFVAIAHLKRLADVEVHVAGNGLEAIKKIQTYDFALILMDISMPEMDGLEATKEIRKIEAHRGKRTPIIAVTASENRQHCLDAGMDDYVTKPADYQRILKKWLPPQILKLA